MGESSASSLKCMRMMEVADSQSINCLLDAGMAAAEAGMVYREREREHKETR